MCDLVVVARAVDFEDEEAEAAEQKQQPWFSRERTQGGRKTQRALPRLKKRVLWGLA